MGALRTAFTSKPFHFLVAGIVLVAVVVVGLEVTKGKPTYPIKVVYSNAPGLFTGAAVDVLGVQVGTVTNVQNVGDKVDVTLAVDQGTRIPSSAFASLVVGTASGLAGRRPEPGLHGRAIPGLWRDHPAGSHRGSGLHR